MKGFWPFCGPSHRWVTLALQSSLLGRQGYFISLVCAISGYPGAFKLDFQEVRSLPKDKCLSTILLLPARSSFSAQHLSELPPEQR